MTMPRPLFHVCGRFEGSMMTFQDLHLNPGDPFPDGSQHLIRIYRGVVYDAKESTLIRFEESPCEVYGKEVNNIQINAGEGSPVKHDRIYSLLEFKLSRVVITGVQTINNRTYGNISGWIEAAVTDGFFDDTNIPDQPTSPSNTNYTPDDTGNVRRVGSDGQIYVAPGSPDTSEPWNGVTPRPPIPPLPPKPSTPVDYVKNIWRWLADYNGGRWLLRLLFFILFLLLIYKFTEFGRQTICYFKTKSIERKIAAVILERQKLQNIINQTRPNVAQCGSQQQFEGANIEQTFTYTLGKESGPVTVSYEMFVVPDRLEVMFNGQLVASTNDWLMSNDYKLFEGRGFSDSTGVLIYDYRYNPKEASELTIRVIPNPNVPTTKWEFNVECPQ
jgi:hypothetical protein